ncbi:MAG: hypothetical protein ACE37D_21610 [Pseudomonadales bacterium]
MTLKEALESWDGKSAADIEAIYADHAESHNFVTQLIKYSANESLQAGATWLLKHHIESQHLPSQTQTTRFLLLPEKLVDWQARLHFLQCLPHLSLVNADEVIMAAFLRDCLGSHNKFLRAWAYSGFHLLAQHYSQYEEEAQHLLQQAIKEEAPSVKARVRNLLKDSKHSRS